MLCQDYLEVLYKNAVIILSQGGTKDKLFSYAIKTILDTLGSLKRPKPNITSCSIATVSYQIIYTYLIETRSSHNMSKFMHWLNRGYAAYFNTTYKTSGHLWQGRFISKPIVKDQYLLHCANYVESNPLRANMIDNISDYKWSSYRERSLSLEGSILDKIEGHFEA